MDDNDEGARKPRSGHQQHMPTWALCAIDPLIRYKLDGSWEGWRKTVQADPCGYCGNRGGDADHIVPRRHGGRNHWHNLTGSCHACNRAKGTMSLLPFIAGMAAEVSSLPVQLGRFGSLTVAATDLEKVIGGSNDKALLAAVLETLLDRYPGTEGALAYRKRRRRGHPHRRWNHALATRPGGADAGVVCSKLGGGGSPRHGGVQAAARLFTPSDDTPTNETRMVPTQEP